MVIDPFKRTIAYSCTISLHLSLFGWQKGWLESCVLVAAPLRALQAISTDKPSDLKHKKGV